MPDETLSQDQAAEALFASIQEDGGLESHGFSGEGAAPGIDRAAEALAAQQVQTPTTTPLKQEVSQEQQQTPDTPPVPTEQQQTPETQEVTDAFTRLDPNTIPEQLKPWYQSMQADYTRKTQAIAEQRKQLEGLDVNAATTALQFYQSLQDPTFAKNFYGQLGSTLTNLGYLEQPQQSTPATPAQETYADPEEFFRAKSQELETKFSTLQGQLEAQRVEAENARLYAAIAGEVQRQDASIRDSNPHYTDADMNAITALAGTDRTLFEAQELYEAAISERLNRMLAAKTQVATTHGQAITPGSATEPPSFGDDLNAAHRAAMEVLRNEMANNS